MGSQAPVLEYQRYLDAVLGGWIGKSIGGSIGARFEGNKAWIEIDPADFFPDSIPPNDDLDLQVLWLKVLEEKGPALTSDDLAAAWMEGCWYPFNEFGIFRRNWQLGIHPPDSGSFGNQFWETGMGCAIRAEIWGYCFPGAPDLAAKFAGMDGVLDHTEQAVGAEQMLASMSSMAFFIRDPRRLIDLSIGCLPEGSTVEQQVRLALRCYDSGVPLRDARERVILTGGSSETTDVSMNIPFTLMALLYGGNDFEATLLAALNCGYDTDCTMATSAALLGQILGVGSIPECLKAPVGDELVMGIEYRRREMTLSALARDTARVGVLFARHFGTLEIPSAPAMEPFPPTAVAPSTRLRVDYCGMPSAAPGDSVRIRLHVEGEVVPGDQLTIAPDCPGWLVVPAKAHPTPVLREFEFTLHAPAMDAPEACPWPQKHLFTATLSDVQGSRSEFRFGVSGAALYQLLGVFFDDLPADGDFLKLPLLRSAHHFVSPDKDYLPDPSPGTLYGPMQDRLGRPPVVISHEQEIDVSRLVGLKGAYCAYLGRTIISPDEQEVFLVVGNNDSFRIELNGVKVAEENEVLMWSPFNNVYLVNLKRGENRFLFKLLKRGDTCRFTFGLRRCKPPRLFHCNDWCVDLADVVPWAVSQG